MPRGDTLNRRVILPSLALCVASRLTEVLPELGVKLLRRKLWAHQPVTRGPERPIVLIVAHRRNG
jgi:hypothetical protein